MVVGDEKSTQRLLEHEELRDIHARIDGLKTETERNHRELTSKLHDLEVAVARGGRFPATAWVAAASLFLAVIGSGMLTFSKLEIARMDAQKAIGLIEQHMSGSSARFQTIAEASAFIAEWDRKLPALDERIKGLENRIVGQGAEGWHRRDHDLYARVVDAQFARIEERLKSIEHAQADLCQRVQTCKGNRP